MSSLHKKSASPSALVTYQEHCYMLKYLPSTEPKRKENLDVCIVHALSFFFFAFLATAAAAVIPSSVSLPRNVILFLSDALWPYLVFPSPIYTFTISIKSVVSQRHVSLPLVVPSSVCTAFQQKKKANCRFYSRQRDPWYEHQPVKKTFCSFNGELDCQGGH